ncbi:YadA-like family protein [Actinobacillus pleuropneumoniae]|uniref:YadA-like family protein n=1 Tax=Actinobacillus pleuropneumoniae TaxID=715 RepID=UPI003D81C2E8
MNKIFKVIWSHATQTFVVVSELTRSKSKAKASVSDVKNGVSSVIGSGFKLSIISSLLISTIPNVYAAIAIDGMGSSWVNGKNINYATNSGTATANAKNSHHAYNYQNPGNMYYEKQSDKNRYSGTLGTSSGIAIGENATTIGDDDYSSGVAIGDYAKATGGLSFALGAYTQATAIGSTVIGTAGLASGFNSLAMMRQSAATANYAMAIGTASWADATASLAMGASATAKGVQSIAIGSSDMLAQDGGNGRALTKYDGTNNTEASGARSVAIGTTARTSADDAIAIGTGAKALNTNTISIGTGNTVTGANSTAIGDPTKISGTGSHSLGNNNTIPDNNSTVIGNNNVLSGPWDSVSNGSHVVGNNVQIRGENSLAFGNNAMVGDVNNEGVFGTVNATAIGTSATAKGENALAVGTGAKASKTNNTAIGTSATVTKDAGEDNIAFGSGATVTRGKNSIVMGKDSKSEAENGSSIAIGDNATISSGVKGNAYVIGTNASIASTNGGIAFGNGAKITNSNGGDGSSVAIGEGAIATGTRAISLGHKANTEGNQVDSIAIGSSAATSGTNNIAIGKEAKANGSQGNQIVVGTSANAVGDKSIVLGTNATAQGNQAEQIVIGTGANASGTSQYSIVMGSGAGATREHSTVLGSKANSIVDGGVALGANSVSDRQAGGSATGHASTNNPYIPGTADPAQIEAINKTKGTTGAVSVGASATSSSPAILRQITNLAAGAEDTDAVNVAQLKAAVTTAVASSSWNIKENTTPKDEVKSGDNVSFSDGTGTTATVEVADSGKTSTVKYSVNKSELSVTGGTVTAGKAGDNFATAEDVAKAINDSEKTSSVVSSTKTIEVTSKVSGNNTEYDLDLSEATKTSLGKADTALQSWEAQANGNKVKTVNKDNATLNFVNGTNIEVTNDNGQVKIATVKAPTFTTVNAENFTTGTVSITDNGINAGNQKITNLANGTANSDAVTLAQLNASKSVVEAGNNTNVRSETATDGSKIYTVDANATTVSGSDALNITKSDAGNNVTNYALDLSDKTKGEIKQGVDANTTVNTKGITFTGDTGTTERKLGETLAINGDNKLINTAVKDGQVSVSATKALTDAVTNATSALQSIVTTADSEDAQTVNKDSNKANFISGTNIQLTPSKDGITVATKESVDFTTVNATTVNATAVNGNTIKSGDVVITKDGINAGNQTISNVKDGTISENSKEAVNGSQLYATNQNVANNTANITKNAENIAKGTVYAGDYAKDDSVKNEFTQALGNQTNIIGGAADKDDLSDNNIGVVSNGIDTLTVKLAKTLTDLTSAEFGEKDSSDKTVINKDGVSSEVIGKDGNVISSTDLTSDGVTSETVIPEVKTTSTNTADDGTTTQTDTTTDGLDTNEVSSQGMTVSTSTTETKTTTVTPKDGTTGPEITTVETDTLKTTGVDNDGIRINTHETVTTTNPDGTTNVVENGGEVSLTSSGLNNGGNRAINVAAGVNATDAVNVSQLEEARTHYYSVNTKTEQANFNNDTATGENSIAAGPNVWAQGVQSAVFGSMAGASSDKATAVGNDAWALGVQSTAIGSGVVAGGKGSVVIGNAENTEKTVSTAEAENSVAIGTHAVVTKADAVAIGHNSGAVNVNTTAIGSGANASGERSTALGNKASSSGNNATALGVEANASGQESNVLGYKANSNGYRAMALGTLSNAAGTMAIALGSQSNASGIKAQAFGSNAIASAEDAIAMGSNANANAVSGVALGNRSMASGVSGVALGDGAASNAQQSISIGKSARTTATNSIALGNASLATADSAIAMGNSSSAVGSNGIAVGAKSKALKDNAIALGNNATVTANNALALGLNSVAYSDNAIVLGTTSKATGSHSVAIGTGASAYRQNSIAMGKDSSTGGDFAVALGDSANAAAENTLALGKNAIADKKDSVALGNNAYTGDVIATESATLAGKEYKFAGTAPVGTVSIGSEGKERTITNVAAGRISSTSTDAINGSQLYAVSEVASRGWNIQANGDTASQVAPGATVQFIDGTNIDITRDGNNITIATAANVVTTETDKYVTGGKVAYDNQGNGTTTLTLKDGSEAQVTGAKNNFVTSATTDANGKKATLTRNDGGTVDIDLTNTVNQAVTEATDKGTKYAGDRAVNDTTANEFSRKLGETTKVLGGATGELSDNNLAVISNGTDTLTVKLAKALSGLTSATFGSDATDQTVINKDGVTINSTTPDKTVSLTETGLNNGGNKITNVKEGEAGTDAVNVNQLNQAITNNAYNWNISDGTNNTAVPDSGTVAVKGSANADSANTVGVVTELEGTNVKVDLSQKAKDDIANGQKHSSVAGDTNFVVTQTTTNAEGGKQYDVKLADTVVIGKDKTNGGNPVTINGTTGEISGLTNTTWDPDTKYEGGKAATQEQLKSVSDVAQKGWNIQANKDTATKVAPGDTVKFIDGENIKITRTGNDITVATAKDVKFDSVKVGDKVSINNDGINAGDTKVTNVTNGTLAADSKDAVNGSQLYATNQNVTNNAANITKNADNIAKGTVYAGDRLDATVTGKTNNFTRALGEQTNVVGGATGELSDNNLAVISNGTDTLTVKLAKSLTDLTNATFGSTDTDKTVINKDGVTVSSDKPEKEVSLTDKGLNNGNNQITNVTSGLVKRDGNPVELSKAEGDVLTNAVNVGDLKTTVTNLTEEGKGGGFGLTAEDNKDVKADLGKTVKVQGDGSVKTTVVEKDGQSALQVGLTENVTVGGQDKPGTITVKGENGKDGVSINGKDGSIGLTGAPGKDGQDAQATIKVVDGTKGLDGNNGKDGESKTRIVYEKPNGGGTEEIATLNDGLNFVGDKGQVIRKKLNDTLAIKGNLDAAAVVTDKNLRVDNDKDQNGELIIKMAKSLTDLTNATFSSDDSDTVIGGNGLTITPKAGNAVSLTDKGLNNGNNTITNVKAGENDTDAVNVSQLKEVKNTANAGWNISANGQNETNVAPKGSVSFNNTDGNVVITKAADNNNVTFNLNNDLTVGGPAGKDGKDGKDGTIGVKGKDGTTGVTLNGKDGSIGLTGAKGADGKDGANATITVANGPVGVDGTDGKDGKDGMTRIVYTDPKGTTHNVSTLNDGLNFAGNQGDTIVKKLNETLTVKGALANTADASSENLRVDSQDGALVVKLAQNLANLTTATFGNTDTDKTVVSKDGVTISNGSDKDKTVSLTDKGLNNGNNQITNVTSGLTDSTGQKSDLANATTTNAVNVGDLKDTVNNLTNATTGGFGLKDDNNTEVKQDLGKTIQIKGKDGVTVTSDVANKSLEVALQGDVTVNGKDGKDGTIGVKGADGKDGTKITKDAVVFNGVDGKDGKDGQVSIKVEQGLKGIAGNDGANGTTKTRIVYEKPNGDKEQVATLNDGLNFVGDKGQVIQKKLNETLAIKGNLDANATVTDKNLRVDNDKDQNGELIIKMAKSLTDLTNATFSSGDINATIGGNGLTITPKGGDVVSLTDKGLNNGNNTITNVAPGVNGTDAVNKDQLDGVNATANAGWNLTTNGDNTNASNVAPNSTVDLANTDGNIVITKAGNNVTFDLNNNLTVGGPGKDGKPGKDGEFGVKGADGKTGVVLNGKDGAVGITGQDGSNGAITVKQGKPGVNGTDGETKTRFVYELKDKDGKPVTYENGTTIVEELATLNDGLNFIGDKGQVIHKKLNDTLAIKGNLTATAAVTDKNLRVDNENGQLIVKMAKSLTDLTNATFGSDNSNTTIGGNGVTITPNGGDAGNTVSLTDKGLNNGNNQVTNVSTGLKGRDGNNVTLENASGDVLNNAVNVGDLKDSVHNLTNATTGGFGLMDEKGKDVKADLGKTVTVKGDGSVKTTVVEVEKDGKKEKFLEVGLTNNVTVGNDKEPGTITVKGENGKDGVSISGKDGISIKGENGQDAVSINGKDGDGTVAVKGKDGKTGVALNGKDGTIGINGKDGSNGSITVAQGTKGLAGNDGKDGKTKTRIVYNTTTPDGKPVTEEVATLNDGLNFVGNDGKAIAKKLNETLAIKGNLSTAVKEVTANNLRVDNVGDELIINMAKALTDLTSATFTNVGGDKSVVTGNGLTITPTKGGNKVSLTTTGLNNGGNKVINVAAGDVNANSTDAVNGSQLYAVSEVANKGWKIQTNGNVSTNVKPGDTVNFADGKNIAITNDGTKVTVGLVKQVDLGTDGSIKAGDTFVNKDGVTVGDNVSLTKDGLKAGNVTISATTGINAGNKQITNVASGLGGKKLSEAKGDTLTNAANIGDLQTAVSSVTDASQGGGFGLADDKGANVTQNLGKTIAVKGDGKNISTVVKDGALTVNLNKDVDLGKDGSVTTGNTKVSDKGVSFADSLVNLTSNGLDNGGNKVTNVRAGDVNANSTDAVNGSQLYATNQNVTNVQNEVAKGWNIEAGTVDGGKVFNASKTKVAMGDTVGVKAGKNIEITQDGSNIAIATSANPTFETVTTESVKVGKGDNTVAIETVTDKHGSALKVSGADGKSETRINNVADGKADNDAVNVRQLRGVAQNVANIDNRVSKLDKRVRGIGANAAAASSLPQVYIPGKSMVALAGGAYSGASAVAVGYSRASDNGKVILKVNGTANSAGHYSGGVGVGYQW